MAKTGEDIILAGLEVDLRAGVVPISRAASSLATLIKRSRTTHQPIVLTQKGYPTGVLLDVAVFEALRELARLDKEPGVPEEQPSA